MLLVNDGPTSLSFGIHFLVKNGNDFFCHEIASLVAAPELGAGFFGEIAAAAAPASPGSL